jgi:hypothetical protein
LPPPIDIEALARRCHAEALRLVRAAEQRDKAFSRIDLTGRMVLARRIKTQTGRQHMTSSREKNFFEQYGGAASSPLPTDEFGEDPRDEGWFWLAHDSCYRGDRCECWFCLPSWQEKPSPEVVITSSTYEMAFDMGCHAWELHELGDDERANPTFMRGFIDGWESSIEKGYLCCEDHPLSPRPCHRRPGCGCKV